LISDITSIIKKVKRTDAQCITLDFRRAAKVKN